MDGGPDQPASPAKAVLSGRAEEPYRLGLAGAGDVNDRPQAGRRGDSGDGQGVAAGTGKRGTCTASSCQCSDPALCSALSDEAWRMRQQTGLAVLIGIATQTSLAMSEAATAIIPAIPDWLGDPGVIEHPPPGLADGGERDLGTPGSRLAALLARLKSDHLVRNSLYLMLSSGIQAALGFAFWIIMARLFSPGDVGTASSLISAIALIAYFALFGLNSTLVRFLPTAAERNALITSALALVAACGAAIGLIYILLTPILAPRLAFVAHEPVFAGGFALLAAASAVNLLTDSVFIASRKAAYCALTDGVVGGLSKIIAGIALVGTGAYGLFCASAGGFAAAALMSIVLMIAFMGWRPSLRQPVRTLRPLLKFSGANYLANALILLPTVVVPVIALDRLGPQSAAYYFVAFQMASLLYATIYATEQAFLAEGSHADANWREIRRRSRRLAIILFLPGCVVLALGAHWVLLAFGPAYSLHGTGSLELLAVAVIPIAACNWSWTVLRLASRLGPLVFSSAVYSAAICAAAWILAPHGLTALTVAWPIGSSLGAAVAAAATAVAVRKPPARHRRTAGSRPALTRTR